MSNEQEVVAENPFDEIRQNFAKFSDELNGVKDEFDKLQKKREELKAKEQELVSLREEVEQITDNYEKYLFSVFSSENQFFSDTVNYADDLYKHNQAEIDYNKQIIASQNTVIEEAHNIIEEATERAEQEAEYRKKVRASHDNLLKQTQSMRISDVKAMESEEQQSSTPDEEVKDSTDTLDLENVSE